MVSSLFQQQELYCLLNESMAHCFLTALTRFLIIYVFFLFIAFLFLIIIRSFILFIIFLGLMHRSQYKNQWSYMSNSLEYNLKNQKKNGWFIDMIYHTKYTTPFFTQISGMIEWTCYKKLNFDALQVNSPHKGHIRGSYPPGCKGWHLQILTRAKKLPFITPYLWMAWRAYSEHVG